MRCSVWGACPSGWSAKSKLAALYPEHIRGPSYSLARHVDLSVALAHVGWSEGRIFRLGVWPQLRENWKTVNIINFLYLHGKNLYTYKTNAPFSNLLYFRSWQVSVLVTPRLRSSFSLKNFTLRTFCLAYPVFPRHSLPHIFLCTGCWISSRIIGLVSFIHSKFS